MLEGAVSTEIVGGANPVGEKGDILQEEAEKKKRGREPEKAAAREKVVGLASIGGNREEKERTRESSCQREGSGGEQA